MSTATPMVQGAIITSTITTVACSHPRSVISAATPSTPLSSQDADASCVGPAASRAFPSESGFFCSSLTWACVQTLIAEDRPHPCFVSDGKLCIDCFALV